MYITLEDGGGARSERQEPGFTPGPWEVTPTYWARSPWEPESAPQRVHSYYVKSTHPYDGDTPTFFAQDIRHKPNALLVAAAPALYEALRDMVALFPERPADDGSGRVGFNARLTNTYDAARAALALVDQNQEQQS